VPEMITIWWLVSIVLLVNILVGLVFVTSRQGSPDALLAVLLFGTTGVALSLTLGRALDQPRAVDIALVFALLTAVIGVAFARQGWLRRSGEGGPEQ